MEQPETEDLADALAATLEALGVEHTAVYGRHTGAQIAVEFAARHPDRCSMALTDGFPVFSAETKKVRLDKYLAPIVPTFDGGHLVWLWFRYRDQHVFWPWNEQRLSHRADTDHGHHGGAAVAVEAALRAPQRVRSLLLDAPIAVEEGIAARWLEGVEPVTPAWNGEHLLRAWHMRRDMELWWPWYDRRRENARAMEPRIDPARLTVELREAMKQPASFAPAWRAVVRYPMRRRLAEVKPPVHVMTSARDVFARCLPHAQLVEDKAAFVLQRISGQA